ncbi:P63C domain-containing protein [Achromobacter sp. AGC25]
MADKTTKTSGRAKGGVARAKVLAPEERRMIAKKAAVARWGQKKPEATHRGNFEEDFGIDVDCYVLNDERKTAVISQRGMGLALSLGEGGSRLPRFMSGEKVAPYVGPELRSKLENPLIFQGLLVGPNGESMPASDVNGYDVTVLIDVCNAIVDARSAGALLKRQWHIADQAQIILNASAKSGIQGLVYKLSGYDATKAEVVAAFKQFVQEEAKKYEQEFPSDLYAQWYRLYEIPVPVRGMPWNFRHLTVKHIYYPLAKSNGKILDLIRAHKSKDGDRQKKLFQFLNDVGARALRIQIGRILEMAESSDSSGEYERKFTDRFGGQRELDLPTQ